MIIPTKQKQIGKDIREEIGRFVGSHPNVSVRFEFSEREHRFLVSYHFETHPDDEDPIWDDVLEMEDYFYREYYDDAPFFCEDNRSFTLSPSAQTIVPVKPARQTSVRVPAAAQGGHSNTVRI